jgi:hypothetical protein
MIVGCKLPSGFTIEVGTPGKEGYAYYHIPGRVGKKDGTASVPNAVGAAWVKDNKTLRYYVDKSIYVVCVE